jgi:hypothetical protein
VPAACKGEAEKQSTAIVEFSLCNEVYSEVERDGKRSRNKETDAETAAAGRRKEGRCMQKQRVSESNKK